MSLTQRLLTSIGRQVSAAVSTLTPTLRAASQYGPAHLTHNATTVPGFNFLSRYSSSLARMHRVGIRRRIRRPQAPILGGKPQMRGVVIKVMVKKPKKPNSANRKCVRVRLTNGEEASAYIPGEGHNLQEHSIVLVEGSKLQDVPGVKLRCVRGKYDLPHVKKKTL